MVQALAFSFVILQVVYANLVHHPSPLKLVIAGAPASGKGTQCNFLRSRFNLVHLSTGDLLRDEVKRGTEIGVKAQQVMDAGQLVPDNLLNSIVCDRLQSEECRSCGWILDGFPRTKSQCDMLVRAGHLPDAVIYLQVQEEELIERMRGRMVDPVTGISYHAKRNIPDAHIFARCVRRSDDSLETLQRRLEQFRAHIDDIMDSFQDRVVEVDGTLPSEELSNVVMTKIQQIKDSQHKDSTI